MSILSRVSEALNPRHLAVQWTREGRVSGLLRAILHELPTDSDGTVALEVDGQAMFEAPFRADADGKANLTIHTHLLQNGPRKLRVRTRHGDDARATSIEVRVDNDGALAAKVREALSAQGVPLAFLGDCDASYYADAGLKSWVDAPDAAERVEAMLSDGRIDASEAGMLLRFLRDGFVILDQALPEAMLSAADSALDDAVAAGYQGYELGSSQRLEQMHVAYPAIRDIWLHAPVHRFLSLVFDAPSQPCQSLVYVFGSQQDAHQDTIHLTPFPAGQMCGVWFALEDVREGSGELMVYPGSHRFPRVYMKDVGAAKVRNGDWSGFGEKVVGRWAQLLGESGIQPMPYMARRGDILVWHENLMHAGSIRRDKSLSRRSVVTHNFASGAVVYYDSSGDVGYVHDVEPAV